MDLPTIIALVVLGLIIGGVVAMLIIDKKKGKSTCSCGCGGCAMREMCHSKGMTRGTKSQEQDVTKHATDEISDIKETK